MLKQFCSILFFVLMATSFVQAQITIGAGTFPKSGDILKTEFDNAPDSSLILITPPGGNQNWDFTSLMSPQTTETFILPPSDGMAAAAFPSATHVIITDTGEAYFRTSSDKQELLGFSGPDPIGLGIDVLVVYDDPATQRKAPLAFGQNYSDNSTFNVTIDADLIPGIDTIGLPITPDSIRLTVENAELVEADAWGKLNIPNLNFDVLRLKRTIDSEIKIEGKAFGIWLDITSIVVGFIDIPTNNSSVAYDFVSNDTKEIVASTTFSNDTVRTVQYIASDYTTNLVNAADIKSRSLIPYPNPAINKVRMDVKGFNAGDYTLKIYNIVGEVVYEQAVKIGKGTTTLKVDIKKLSRGTFLCSLVDKRNRVVVTSRLVKMGA